MRHAAAILLSVTLALFLLLAGFFSVYYDQGPHGMYASYAGEQKAQVSGILHFLNSNEGAGALSFLDASEQSHMADVRRVLNGFRIAAIVVIIILSSQLYLLLQKNHLLLRNKGGSKKTGSAADAYGVIRKSLLWGGAGALALAALLALSSLFDFASFWTAFHHVLFPQGNWQFPYNSALITLFSQRFFENFAEQVLLATAGYALLALSGGALLDRATCQGSRRL